MKRKIKYNAALLLAVLISMLALTTGCAGISSESSYSEPQYSDIVYSGEPLTTMEYYEALRSLFSDFSDAMGAIPFSKERQTVAKMKPYWNEAKTQCQRAREALDKFTELNPPEKYDKKHKELLSKIAQEKHIIDSEERFLTASNYFALKRYGKEMTEAMDIPVEQQFSHTWMLIVIDLKAELGLMPQEYYDEYGNSSVSN